MAHDPNWHREYAILELAEMNARAAWRSARGAKKVAALEVLRTAGAARWEFEMAACRIINVGLAA